MKEQESVYQKIQSLDAYGSKIELFYKNNKEHPTFFGGVVTIFNLLALIFISYSFGAELFLKQKPVIIFSEETIKQPEIYNMTKETFSISFGMQDPNTWNHFIDESVMIKVFNSTTQQWEQVWQDTDLGPYPCNIDQFQVEGSQEFYKELSGIDQMYCFDQTDNKAWIAGDFSANFFGVLDFSVYQCQNKTEEETAELIKLGKKVVICKSQEEIDNLLSNGYFAAYYTDKVINPKNLDKPFSTNPRDIFWPTSNKLRKELTIYLRNIYIESDLGLMTNDISTQRDVTFSYSTEQVIYGQSNQFLHMVLRFEKSKQSRYYRSYMKVEDLLAQISGVMDFVVILSTFICVKMSRLDLSQSLVNEVFSFQSQEEEQSELGLNKKKERDNQALKVIRKIQDQLNISRKNKQKSEKQLQQLEGSKNQNEELISQLGDDPNKSDQNSTRKRQNSELLSQFIKGYKSQITTHKTEKEEKEYLSAIEKLFKVSHSVIRLYFYEYILYYLFPCWRTVSRKKRQIDYCKELLDKHLDVMYIVNKLQEVDKLKMVLLSEDQIKLFNYLPKPTIRESVFIQQENDLKNKKISNQDKYAQNENLKSIENKMPSLTNKQKFYQIEKFNLLYMDDRSNIQKATDAYTSFENLRKQQQKTQIDTKLLLMLDPKILDYFLEEKEIESYHDLIKQGSNDNLNSNQNFIIQGLTQKMRNKVLSQFSKNQLPKNNEVDQQEFANPNSNSTMNASGLINQDHKNEELIQDEFSSNNLFFKYSSNQVQPNNNPNQQQKLDEVQESNSKELELINSASKQSGELKLQQISQRNDSSPTSNNNIDKKSDRKIPSEQQINDNINLNQIPQSFNKQIIQLQQFKK